MRDEHGLTYLGHAGSALDVLRVITPYRVSDDNATALTDYNARHLRIMLEDGASAQIGIRRVERTASGGLQIRPRTSGVNTAYNGLGKAFKDHFGFDFLDKLYPGWCVLPGEDGEEVWEFDWSYWPQGHDVALKRPDGKLAKTASIGRS